MATVIDSLLVTLGLDVSDYKKGEKEAEKATKDLTDKTEKSNKKIQDDEKKRAKERERQHKQEQARQKQQLDALNKMRNQMLGVMGVFTAGQGIISFASNALTAAASIGRLSENTGMSVEEIAGFGQALERIGGSAEEARQTISMLSTELAKNRAGMDSNINEYAAWNGSIQHGELSNTKEYLLGIADAFQRLNESSPADAWMKAQRMGISENTFNLLKRGRDAVKAQIADGAALTGINKKQAEQAKRQQESWADLMAHLSSIGRAVLFPVLEAISGWMAKNKGSIHEWIELLRNKIEKFTPKALEKVGYVIENIVKGMKLALKLLEKLDEVADNYGLGKGSSESINKGGKIGALMNLSPMLSLALGAQELSSNTTNNRSEVKVKEINIYESRDAKTTAKEVRKAMMNPWPKQAISGMN